MVAEISTYFNSFHDRRQKFIDSRQKYNLRLYFRNTHPPPLSPDNAVRHSALQTTNQLLETESWSNCVDEPEDEGKARHSA